MKKLSLLILLMVLFSYGITYSQSRTVTEVESNNTRDVAMSVAYDDTVNAAVSPVNDIDYYKIHATAGDTLTVNVERRNTSQLWGRITLYDNLGNQLESIGQDYTQTAGKMRFVYMVPQTNDYYIKFTYRQNYSGVSAADLNAIKEMDKNNKFSLGPQLGVNDEGEYKIWFEHFKKSAPVFMWSYYEDLWFNSVRLGAGFYSNGVPTKATVEYGLTTAYGNSVVLVDNFNNIGSYPSGFTSNKLTGLPPNTLYHFRVILQNSMGSVTSSDNTFITAGPPNGWTAQNSNVTSWLNTVDFLNDQVGFAAGDQNIIKTIDGGITWNIVKSGISSIRAIDVIDANTVYAAGYSNQVWKSIDGGTNWTLTNPTNCYGIMGVSFYDVNNGIIVTDCGTMYKTADAGTSWTQITLPTSDGLLCVKILGINKIVAAGGNRRVLVSNDGGTTWSNQQLTANGWGWRGIAFADQNTGYLVGDQGIKAKTIDGGTTWTIIDAGGGGAYLYGAASKNVNENYAVGDAGTLLKTMNGGTNWFNEATGTGNGLFGIAVAGNSQIAVGSWGTILKSGSYLKVVTPNGGESWKAGAQKNITWGSGGVDNVKIEWSSNNGSNWTEVISSTPSSGSFQWTVPNNVGTQNKIRITSTADAALKDESDAVFSIVASGPIAEVEPNNLRDNTAMSVAYGDTVNASISPINDIDYFRISCTAGDTLMVYSENRNSSTLDGEIYLLNKNGNVLVSNDDFQNTSKSRIIYIIQSSDEYFVRYVYYGNRNGIPQSELSNYSKEEFIKSQNNKGPQLGTNDEGEYRISFDKFKRSAPVINNPWADDVNYNTIRFGANFYPNGLPTKATIEYGITTSYGNSIVITTNANSIDSWGITSEKLSGIQSNTLYHFRVKVENALGSQTSEDYTVNTPSTPVGWAAQNSGTTIQLNTVDLVDNNIGFAAGDQNILKTIDGGINWAVVKTGVNSIQSIDAVDANTIFAVGYSNQVWKTVDGGTNWTVLNPANCYGIYGVSFYDVNNGVIVTSCGTMYKTVNGGTAWTQITLPTSDALLCVKMLSANKIIAAGGNRRVLVSNDGGSTWSSQQLSGNSWDWRGITFADQNTGFLDGTRGMKAKTIDGGTTWTTIDAGGNGADLFGAASKSANENYLSGDGGTILKTVNGGTNWIYEATGTWNSLMGIAVAGSKVIAVGGWGTILKSTDYLKVATPNGGESWKVGTQKNITWSSSGVTNVKIEWSSNNGGNWTEVISSTPSSGSFQWTVPNNVGTQNKIRITSTADAALKDESDTVFSIVASGPIAEVEPNNLRDNTAMSVAYGDTVNASISPINDIDYYKINGTAGDTLMVNAETRGASQLYGRLRIIDQNGNWYTQSTSYDNSLYKQRIVYVLPYTGTYWLRYSYRDNYSGIPSTVIENEKKESQPNQIALGPQLGTYDEGEYRICFDTFKKSAPVINSAWADDINYNSIRFGANFYPNGLPTKATIEYGTTTSYGNSVILATNANSIDGWGNTSEKISGIQPNTLYHFRLKVENALGSQTGSDYTINTPPVPQGWSAQNSGTSNWLYAIDFVNDQMGFAAGNQNILKTVDGGTTWNIVKTGVNTIRSIDAVDANTIFAVGYSNQVWKTVDGGTNWTVSNPANCYGIYGVSFYDINNGVIVTDCGTMYKTANGGTSWTQITLPTTDALYCVKMLGANKIIAAGGNRRVLVSNDGGSSWNNQQLTGNSWDWWGMTFADQNTGFLVGSQGMKAKTIDGGTTWTTIDAGGNSAYLYSAASKNTNENFLSGDGGTILKTVNGGTNWIYEATGTWNSLMGIAVAGSKVIAVGGWGTILKSTDYLKVATPNGGESWKVGTQKNITWSSSGVTNVKIEWSSNNGGNWTEVIASTPSNGSYLWTVPNNIGTQNKIRITSTSDASLKDESDAVFNIIGSGPIAEIEPNNLRDNTAMSVAYGDTVNATISPINDIDYYKINGTAGDTLMVNAETRGTSQLMGRLGLIDQNGIWNTESSSYNFSSYKQRIVYVLPYTGTYWLRYSYSQNYSGVPSTTIENDKKGNQLIQSVLGPQLGINDEGEYLITFNYYRKSSPALSAIFVSDLNYNSTRIGADFYSNGLPTKATIEYGPNESYGNNLTLVDNANDLNLTSYVSNRITGLNPNFTYHYRVIVQNALGTNTSPDRTFTTLISPTKIKHINIDPSYQLISFDFVNENEGWIVPGGNLSYVLHTLDGGENWSQVNTGSINGLNDVDFIDQNNGWLVGKNGKVLKTSDGGKSWSVVNIGTSNSLTKISFTNSNLGVIEGGTEFFKTIDGGINWIRFSKSYKNYFFINENVGWASGGGSTVFNTSNGGTSWQLISGNSQNPESISKICFFDLNNGLASGGGYNVSYLRKSQDAGVNWSYIYSQASNPQSALYYYINDFSVLGQNIIGVGNYGRIVTTTNNGSSWDIVSSGTNNLLKKVQLVNKKYYILGEYNTFLKSVDYVNLISPNGGENWKTGSQKSISWSSSGVINVKIEWSSNNGTNWTEIIASTPSNGSYLWTVPNNIGTQNKIRITSTSDASLKDESDAVFGIIATGPIAEIEPNNLRDNTAMSVAYGDTVNAAISPINDVDYYKINGTAGDTLMVNAETRGTSQLYGRLRIIDQNGNWFTENTNYNNSSYKQRITFVLQYTGTYWLRYSYRENYSGIPSTVLEDEKKESQPNQVALGPQLGINDEGEYRISFDKFKKSAPAIYTAWSDDINYNTARLGAQFYPNGLPTKATIEYGTTTGYGNSLVLTTNANYYDSWGTISDKINGLQPNTTYHYRAVVENSLGTATSSDYVFTTPSTPVGWALQNSNVTSWIYTIDFANDLIGYAAGEQNILKTIDGGTNWTVVKTGVSSIQSIDAVDANIIFAVGRSNQVWKSIDGGTNWTVSNPTNCYGIYGVSFFDANNGMIVTDCGTMYKTLDGGTNWTQITLPTTDALYSVKMLSANKIIAAGGNRRVLLSNDGGTNWNNQQLTANGWGWRGITFADQNTGFLVGDQGMKAKSIDGGSTWTVIDVGNGSYLYSTASKNANENYAVGSGGTILKTVNGGTNWINELSGTQNSIRGVAVAGSKIIAVGMWGTILKSTDYVSLTSPKGGETWTVGSTQKIKWNSSNVSNIKIEYTIDNGTNWISIADNTPAVSGEYSWPIPNSPSVNCKVRITDVSNASIVSTSGTFKIEINTGYVSQWGSTPRGTAWPILNTVDTPAGQASMGSTAKPSAWATIKGGFETLTATTAQAFVVSGTFEFVGGGGGNAYTALRYALTYQDSPVLNNQNTTSAAWTGGTHSGYEFTPRTGIASAANSSSGAVGTVWTVVNSAGWNSTNVNNGGVVANVLQFPNDAIMAEGVYDWAISVQPLANGTNEVRWYFVKQHASNELQTYAWAGTFIDPTPSTNKFNSICFANNNDLDNTCRQVNLKNVKAALGNPILLPYRAVTFKVDMNTYKNASLFNAAADKVQLRGSFNGWTSTNDELKDGDGDGIYENNMNILENSLQEYKFFVTSPNASNYGWEGNIGPDVLNNGNRKLSVGNTDLVLPVAKYNNITQIPADDNAVPFVLSKQYKGYPVVSIDGKKVAYISSLDQNYNAQRDIWMADISVGFGGINITNPIKNSVGVNKDWNPIWNPSNPNEFYFITDRLGNRELKKYNLQINLESTVRSGISTYIENIRISPDGSKFVCDYSTTPTRAIRIYSADGSTVLYIVVSGIESGSMFPDWSPDGSRILFTHHNKVYTIKTDGTDLKELITLPGANHARYSPDGSQIAVETLNATWDIVVMNSDGTNPVVVTTTKLKDDLQPSWDPMNNRLYFVSTRDDQYKNIYSLPIVSNKIVWKNIITVSNANNVNSQVLTFGVSPAATDAIDAGLGEASLPPLPPGGFDSRLVLPGALENSLKDFRKDGADKLEWIVKFQAGDNGYPVTVSWDPTQLADGLFTLSDLIGGSIFNVNMASQNNLVISNEGITSFKITYQRKICSSITVNKGWNIIGAPVNALDMSAKKLFVNSDSPNYEYNAGYKSITSFTAGKGYWARFPNSEVISICGSQINSQTIPVIAGWNLISVYNNNISVNKITSTPSNIILSPFYGFDKSYQNLATLEVGKGYWVKVGANGVINISGALAKNSSEVIVQNQIDEKWIKIVVSDKYGRSGIVYASKHKFNAESYSLPPSPPLGEFDLRWDNDNQVAFLSGEHPALEVSTDAYPLTVSVQGADLNFKDRIGGKIVNKKIRSGETFLISNEAISSLEVSEIEIPVSYELMQNYPNPFNPTTKIKFALPADSHVKITIYNQLGERIDQLIDQNMEAGYHEFTWKADHLASGIYFYELVADNYRSIKKMLLIK